MALKAKNYKFPRYDLKFEFEYITITRETAGSLNDFGEPAMTWATQADNVKCEIQPIKALSVQQLGMFTQGLIEVSTNWCLLEAGTDIQTRDRVTDVDGKVYSVIEVSDWRSHIEILTRIEESSGQ